ncbi:MAG: alpha/beta hydrolase [Holophagales bacterium]|nr:alpha/beta hydrolase [Holophagales bacterium]
MRRALPALALAALFVAFFAAGAFFADPIGLVASAAALRFRSAGALSTFVPGPGGARLHAWELGPRSAEVPVVLLHGLGAASHYWVNTAIDLARSGRTVIVPDAPGSGKSAPPAPGSGWGIPGRVAAVSALLDALRFRKVDLVGHSLGGWTAGAFALAEPHRVRRLVLVDSAGFTKLDPDAERALRQSLTPGDRAGARRLYDLLFLRKPVPAWGFLVDALGRTYRQENVAATVAALEEKDGLLGRESLFPPGTVFIHGARDAVCLLSDAREAFALVPKGRLFVVRGTGHDVPLEAPRLFHETLRRALEERRPE